MTQYYRPIVQTGPGRPDDALTLAGGWGWFSQVEVLERGATPKVVSVQHVPPASLERLTAPRPEIAGLSFDRPRIMGILNTTPDSFSDGGENFAVGDAVASAQRMQAAGILDVGGESTRPGADFIPPHQEIERTAPVIKAIRAAGDQRGISIDTRKAAVAQAALDAGANLVNDVSGFTFDERLIEVCASHGVPVCVMHAQGDPATMQQNPTYDDVVLDVYDFLDAQIARLELAGITRNIIIADPGIGFGKTLEHNLKLLARLSLFHGLGVPVLLGASRKRFIGTIGGEEQANRRMPGSIAVVLAALQHGIQIVRVHDVAETSQAIALWRAAVAGEVHG